jgi:glycosyltransferase involved in cell wall biosynthesis
MAARAHPLVFVAHTALGPELPTYLPDRARKIAERAGEALDVALARRADATVAIAPMLCERLSRSADREIAYVPVPWTVPPAIDPAERAKARARFGLGALDPVLLYAGNLEPYQGLSVLAEAFGHVRARKPDAQLIVATAAEDVSPIERALWSAGCRDAVRFAPLADEPDRRIVHAAADAVCIPRGSEGGLPIKLLDALSRGVPTIAARRATAGLSLEGAVVIARDDDAEALAAAALLTLEGRESAAQLGRRGTEYIGRAHAPERYLEAMDAAVGSARRRG